MGFTVVPAWHTRQINHVCQRGIFEECDVCEVLKARCGLLAYCTNGVLFAVSDSGSEDRLYIRIRTNRLNNA